MKVVVIAALLATVTVAADSDYEALFNAFKGAHKKVYVNKAEEVKRFNAFVENMKAAEVLQAANPLATFGPNAFADIPAAEFKSYHNGENYFKAAMKKLRNEVVSTAEDRKAAVGQKIDWRAKGAVTAVKNQGQCGSCWSFATTGNIEGQWFLAGNTLTSLSEQELVSCDTIDSGCNGGLMDNAFNWLIESHGGSIVTEAALPYSSGWGVAPACPSNLAAMPIGATINGYNDVQKSEDAMAAYTFAHGPVAIALDATSFQTYTSGILTNCISQQIDHGVLIVGFDDTNVPPYWIVKNSWGADWGEAGYIRIAKGSNQCLITEYPTSSRVGGGTTSEAIKATTPTYSSYTQTVCTGSCGGPCQDFTFPVACTPNPAGSTQTICTSDTITIFQYSTNNCSGIGGGPQYWVNDCMAMANSTFDSFACNP